MSIRVSLIEDDACLRETLTGLLARTPGMECASQHPNAEHALEHLPAATPAVVLVDIELPGLDGIECVRQLLARQPALLPVMLTKFGDDDRIFESLRAGAVGYLLKRSSFEEITAAILEVHAGGSPMTAEVARRVLRHFHAPPAAVPGERSALSSRELEIFQLIAAGLTSKEIGAQLGISRHTVDQHVRNVCVKLSANGRRAIARRLFPPA